MKLAVCVSGLVNGNYVKRNIEVLRQKFSGADFYFGTWNDQKDNFNSIFPELNCFYFKPPEIHYHPYDDEEFNSVYWTETKNWAKRNNQRKEWTKNHTKQHIIHAWMLDSIENEYDVIVRTRFDAFVWKSPTADFTSFIEDSFKNKRSNCFAVTQKKKFKELYESDYVNNPKMKEWCLDQLIIHPRSAFNTKKILELHNKKLLRAAEFGWYQVLCEPSKELHRNWHGWVNHDKNVEKVFLDEG